MFHSGNFSKRNKENKNIKSDSLNNFQNNRKQFPTITKLSLEYNTTFCSSAPAERLL